MTHEEMLEIAAEREAVNKTALESMGIDYENFGQKPWDESMLEETENNALNALDNLHQNNDNGLKELAEMERQELIEQLEVKKKENFRLVAKHCMQEYEKTYNHDTFPVDESWVYMVGEYFGTGEGQTVCIMMTQANPGHAEDFETSTNRYVPCTTKEYRAVREFHEQFGTWMLHGLKFLTREAFFGDYAFYIPPMMMKLNNQACYKTFYTKVHYNFA